jgi:hypothetical protein
MSSEYTSTEAQRVTGATIIQIATLPNADVPAASARAGNWATLALFRVAADAIMARAL